MTCDAVLEKLHYLADDEKIIFKEKKYGIIATNSLGIYHKDLKIIAKDIGFNNKLAIELFDTGIYEARLLCSKIFRPKNVTEDLMEKWVKTFENWEICDSFSMGVFSKSELALAKILDWTKRTAEFEKRAGFAIMASYCMADKTSSNDLFEQFFPIIKSEANDERLYVKKAVNWALRSIGKRNKDLNKTAIKISKEILTYESSSAQWIAKDALKELQKEGVRISDYPRAIYRKT
ncbi:DNA alkylation repair protein [Seonamhaeicola marinus]|uniref:DNA alkylation repair protein n=1 Tax=Seonamhaeicola marinus TaxID=1912246 RepID=A0A5D0IM52_9FLAO|nr:DNA alkylation repair protein [Seonamhaeicola marinus]TYA84258.1 DNA alkylation repair protein [Seonamhaeicola marinus]